MSAVTLSSKRQVVLPSELCRQLALKPGAKIDVSLSADGSGILIRPAAAAVQKPASVLFGRHTHFGKPVSVEEMQGLLLAKRPGLAGTT